MMILEMALINALVIFGFNKATQFDYCHPEDTGEHCKNGIDMDSRMILWKVRFYCLKYFGQFWSKPLVTCPPCMASFHSLYIYWMVFPLTYWNLMYYPLYVLILSGLVSLINSVTKYGNS
jgi:hypothetical protein